MSMDFTIGIVIGFLVAMVIFHEPTRNKVKAYLFDKKKPKGKK